MGRLGPLLIPRGLPDDLRGELIQLAKDYRVYQRKSASDLAMLAELAGRKAVALRAWADLPEPLSSSLVRSEAARAEAAVDSIRAQLANQQDRTGVLLAASAPVAGDGRRPDNPQPVQGLGVAVRSALDHLAATRPGTVPVSRLLALVCLLRAARGSEANLTGLDLRAICGLEADTAVYDLVGSGWLVVDAETLADATDEPVKCGVPATAEFTLGKLPRTRSSGWVARAIGHKKLKRKPAAVRLAAVCVAAHADAGGWLDLDLGALVRILAVGDDDVPGITAELEAAGWLEEVEIAGERLRARIPAETRVFVDALRSSTPVQTILAARAAAAAEAQTAS